MGQLSLQAQAWQQQTKLAVTLLHHAGKYELSANPTPAKCRQSTHRLASEELKSFVSGLFHTTP